MLLKCSNAVHFKGKTQEEINNFVIRAKLLYICLIKKEEEKI